MPHTVDLDIALTDDEKNLLVELQNVDGGTTIINGEMRKIINNDGVSLPNRPNIQLKNINVYDDGLDKTIAEIETLTNVELEKLLSID